jgi:PAS domain-containing protein
VASEHPPAGPAADEPTGLTSQQRSDARLQLALSAGGLGVWEWQRDTDEIEWDLTTARLYGRDLDDAPPHIADYLDLVHPDDRDELRDTVRASLASGDDFSVIHRIVQPESTVRWLQTRGHPVSNGEHIVAVIGVVGDVTAQRLAEVERERLLAEESAARAEADAERARLELILEAKEVISQHLDLDARLREFIHLSVPRLADGGAVHLVDADGRVRLHALAHRDPEQRELVERLFELYPVRLDQPVGIGALIRGGRSGWLPNLTDEMLVGAASTSEQLAMLRRLDITSALVVPLVGPDGPFGSVTFITTRGRRMREADLRLVEQVCSRVAILLHNAQLTQAIDAERLAHRYQAALLTSVLEASVDGVLAVGIDGTVLTHNQRFLELWGIDESLIQRGDDALLAEAQRLVADPEGFVATVKRAYEERPVRFHDQVELRSGRVLDRHGTCLVDTDGEYLGFLWNFRDVTVEKAHAEAIAEAGRRSATLARTLQQSLLPPRLPHIDGVDLAARYHPASEGLDVGGDFYDVFSQDDDWLLVIGDVCGKGAEAAAITALVRWSIRAAASRDTDPTSLLTELNGVMLTDPMVTEGVPRFATVCCIRLRRDDGGVWADIACGGHQPPFAIRADGLVEEVGVPGTLLGVFDEVSIETVTTRLEPGDAIVLLTDGVLEARDPAGDQLEVGGVEAVLARCAREGAGPAQLCRDLADAAISVQDDGPRDDIAILAARVEPS